MQREERLALMEQALERNRGDANGAFLIFGDKDRFENYVQLTSFGVDDVTYMEAASRDWGEGHPLLSDEQVGQLCALGFSAKRTPNHGGDFPTQDASEIARICEEAMSILGSPADFTLQVVSHLD